MPATLVRLRAPVWPRWPRRTARLRFTAIYGGLFLVSGAVLVAITYALFERATRYSKPKLPQIPHSPSIQALRVPSALLKNFPGLPTALSQAAQDQNHLAQVQHQLSTLYVPVSKAGPRATLPVGDLTSAQNQLTQDEHQLTQAVNQLAQAVHQVARAGSAQAAQRATDSHQLLVNSGIALAIVAVLALLVGWLVAGRMLRPIRTITRTAQRISSNSLDERLSLQGPPDELKELGDTLDDLFGRLDAAFVAQRHFVANASHELRTPLTAERNLLQVALDDPHTDAQTWRSTAKELLASNDEQKQLIDALLTLATSERGLEHRERTDLANICETVLPRADLDARRLGLHFDTAISSAPLDGDPTLIECLVTNLVDNAVGHNVVGGQVQIATGATDGKAFLSVTNTGPVIPPGEVDRLFQPFQRLDPRRTHHKTGQGLGLSIVQAIATTHHATITARAVPEGGLSLSVTFPPPPGPGPKRISRTRRLAGSRA